MAELEYIWVGVDDPAAPVIVFLHEGLGSVAMWKDFPAKLCLTGGFRGLVYSRAGYGRSTPRPHDQRWGVDFMHSHAIEVLPAFLASAGVNVASNPPWLFGHSDGGSIALIHAARYPSGVAGVIAAAPHIFVEELTLQSIERAREIYLTGDLRSKLARYHHDVDSAFWGWNDVWLKPEFRSWNIEELLPSIRCAVLAVQGYDDEYGTMAQVDGLAKHVPQTRILRIAECGHSAHRDQPEKLIRAAIEFIRNSGRTL
jgi:pimeloyl-ACP methyl ester carboxylesterase